MLQECEVFHSCNTSAFQYRYAIPGLEFDVREFLHFCNSLFSSTFYITLFPSFTTQSPIHYELNKSNFVPVSSSRDRLTLARWTAAQNLKPIWIISSWISSNVQQIQSFLKGGNIKGVWYFTMMISNFSFSYNVAIFVVTYLLPLSCMAICYIRMGRLYPHAKKDKALKRLWENKNTAERRNMLKLDRV